MVVIVIVGGVTGSVDGGGGGHGGTSVVACSAVLSAVHVFRREEVPRRIAMVAIVAIVGVATAASGVASGSSNFVGTVAIITEEGPPLATAASLVHG